MGIGQVGHVDVVAHADSIAGWIIAAENFERSIAVYGLQDQRNEVRFRGVNLSKFPLWIGPGGIEISQRHKSEIVYRRIPAQCALHDELRFTIRIQRGNLEI